MDVAEEIVTGRTPANDGGAKDASNIVSAKELFCFCDTENKGFVTRNDMGRLCSIVPFNKRRVEQMFDCLDTEQKGKITFDEFLSRYCALLDVSSRPDIRRLKKRHHSNGRALSPIREIINDPHEEFVNQADHSHLFKKYDVRRHQQLELLYEKLKPLTLEEKTKALSKERFELERKVISIENMLAEIETEIKRLTADDLGARERREQYSKSVSSEVSLEEELMAAEADELRRRTKWPLDENDTETFPNNSYGRNAFYDPKFREKDVCNYCNNRIGAVEEVRRRVDPDSYSLPMEQRISAQLDEMLHGIEDLAPFPDSSSSESSSISSALEYTGIVDEYERSLSPSSKAIWKVTCRLLPQDEDEQKTLWKVKLKVIPLREKMVIYPQVVESKLCEQPLSSDVCDRLTTPARLFKIILVGDSGVGKTSFIQRFCSDSFKTSFHSTIGIDFQVKSIMVNNRCISLQLWDTAGQERFRCMSKQYFRKSDAVIVMYDVTSEHSFRNIRQWFAHVKENTDDGAVILLLGNKVDARHEGQPNVVLRTHGKRLAEEYGALFFETSAKSGANINEAMVELSSLLQEKEDHDMDKSLILDESPQKKKRWC